MFNNPDISEAAQSMDNTLETETCKKYFNFNLIAFSETLESLLILRIRPTLNLRRGAFGQKIYKRKHEKGGKT